MTQHLDGVGRGGGTKVIPVYMFQFLLERVFLRLAGVPVVNKYRIGSVGIDSRIGFNLQGHIVQEYKNVGRHATH